MNPSRPFILRPVATLLLMVALLLAGLIAYRQLPVAALPQVDTPTIQVATLYPGASPDVMATAVTAPLERQFGQMPGLVQLRSSSSAGASLITLRFVLDLPLDVAEQQVQAAISSAASLLPNDLPMPPSYSKVNPADAPVLTLAVTSPTLPVTRLHELVETRLAPKISQTAGVGLVAIAGGRRPAVRIQVNPGALAALGLSFEQVRVLIGQANVNLPKGTLEGAARSSAIDANDQLRTPADYGALILAYRNGNPVRLRDVAELREDGENLRLGAWAGTLPGVILNVQRQPGANVIDTVERVLAQLPALRATLPAGLDVQVLGERTTTIRASVRDVQHELLLAVALVVMVIFLFLRHAAATLIPAAAVPLSLVGTFGVMHLAGFSLNNLTLMALTLSTGFVVDDAIVMIENIARHLEKGERPLQAALKGSAEIGFTIVSLTFSLTAVLIPLLFMSDVVGRLFHEFAVTMAVSILVSAVVSLTLTPMLCAHLLRPESAQHHGRLYHAVGRGFDALLSLYERGLDRSLAWPKLTLAGFAATVALTAGLYIASPKGFFPPQDTGALQAITEAPGSISYAAMAERQQAMAALVQDDPAVASVASFIGVDAANPTLNTGRLLITLKPHAERDGAAVVARRLAAAAQAVPGLRLYLQPVQDLTLEEGLAKTPYQFTLSGPDRGELDRAAVALQQRLATLPQLRDVSNEQMTRGLQAHVEIDRDACARLGVSVTAINAALYNAFGQRPVSTIFTASQQLRVVLEADPRLVQGPQALAALHVPGAGGQPVPLASVARWRSFRR